MVSNPSQCRDVARRSRNSDSRPQPEQRICQARTITLGANNVTAALLATWPAVYTILLPDCAGTSYALNRTMQSHAQPTKSSEDGRGTHGIA